MKELDNQSVICSFDMEEKSDFQSLMAKFHSRNQEGNGGGPKPPVPVGGKPAIPAYKPKPVIIPKKAEPESDYISMQSVFTWRELTKELSSPNLKELAGGQIGTKANSPKVKEEIAKLQLGVALPTETSPRQPLGQIVLQKTLNEKDEKSATVEGEVSQTRRPMNFHQSLIKKLTRNPSGRNEHKNSPTKDSLPPKPVKPSLAAKPHIPRRKSLPNPRDLGPRPAKPARPPHVDLKRFAMARGLITQTHPTNIKTPDCVKYRFETKDLLTPKHSPARGSPLGAVPLNQTSPSCTSVDGSKRIEKVSAAIFVPEFHPRKLSEDREDYDDIETVRPVVKRTALSPPPPIKPKPSTSSSKEDDFYDDVGSLETIFPPPPPELCKSQELRTNWKNLIKKQRQVEEKEFRKKFKFDGEIKVLTRMMVDPNAIIKKCGNNDLPHKRGDFIDVIQYTSKDKILCRNIKWKFGYVPARSLLAIERDVYDDVGIFDELYDDIEFIKQAMPPALPMTRLLSESELYAMKQANEKNLKKIKKEEKEDKDIRKKFKLEGELKVLTQMMVDPNAKIKKGGGKYLSHKRGEILDVIERTSLEKLLCRNSKGKYGYVPRLYLLQVEQELYDYVDMSEIQRF